MQGKPKLYPNGSFKDIKNNFQTNITLLKIQFLTRMHNARASKSHSTLSFFRFFHSNLFLDILCLIYTLKIFDILIQISEACAKNKQESAIFFNKMKQDFKINEGF